MKNHNIMGSYDVKEQIRHNNVKSFMEMHDKEPKNMPGTEMATEAIKDVYQVCQYDSRKQVKRDKEAL